MQHLAHAVACSACSRFAIAVMQHLAHAVLIYSLSLTRAWAVAWAVLATRMWTPDAGQRPLQQREINDRQQLVKERRLQKTVLVWCVCVGVRSIRRPLQIPHELVSEVSEDSYSQRCQFVWYLQRWQFVSRISGVVSILVHVGVYAYRHARLATREHAMHAS